MDAAIAGRTSMRRRPAWRAPWRDRTGRFSLLRLCTFVAVVVLPAAWVAALSYLRWLDFFGNSIPWETIVIETGAAAMWLMLATLCVTPLRKITGNNLLIGVRRMLGLTAFVYGLAHLVLYFILRRWEWPVMAEELGRRITIVYAIAAFVPMMVLGLTSADGAIKWLGRNWNRLHWLVYPATALAVLHYVSAGRSYGGPPFASAGIFIWLMGWRLMNRFRLASSWWSLPVLTLVSAALSVGFEVLALTLARRGRYFDPLSFDNGAPAVLLVLLFGAGAVGLAALATALRSRRVTA
jgi:sulfoxide reductase heme-binding subunit YedZ